jgi:superfamily I DNA/RNA helicase
MSGAVILKLKRNCRNTEQIINETELATGADIGVTEIKGKGPPVIYCRVNDKEEAAKKLDIQLSEWTESGVSLGDIAIMSSLNFKNSFVLNLSSKWLEQIVVLNSKNVSVIGSSKIIFSTVKSFKGLERKFVAISDIDLISENDELLPNLADLYVSMTRGNAGLWIAYNKKFESQFKKIREKHARQMVEKEKGGKL